MNRNVFLYFFISILIFLGVYNINQHPVYGATALQNAQAEKSVLENQLKELEKEIAAKQKDLDAQKGQSVSLSRDISILTTQINKAKLNIQSKNLTIQKLGGEITEKTKQIKGLESRIDRIKDSLAQMIRKNREIDNKPILALVLTENNLSDVYGDISSFASIKRGIQNSVSEIKEVKSLTELERGVLEEKKNKEIDTKVELENSKKKVESAEAEKKVLLSISKNKEAEYSKILEERKVEAAKIRAKLFELAGGIDGGGVSFEDAVKYADYASGQTGVRTAFILGILKQETNIGKNVGLCRLTNATTGESQGVNSGKIFTYGMKPTRDVQPFLSITKSLGIDPYSARISCPLEGVPGWGGAMGPSQFIPSTWTLFASRIANKFDVKTANPWNPQHAIMATALYLQDLGAAKGGYTAEINAACKYYSGRSCSDPAVKNAFYGNAVMSHTATIEKEIQFIKEN